LALAAAAVLVSVQANQMAVVVQELIFIALLD
jgi:hypothetical protein